MKLKKEKKDKPKKEKKDKKQRPPLTKKKKIILLIVLLLLIAAGAGAFFFLRGGEEQSEQVKEDKVVEAPDSYAVSKEYSVAAIPVGKGTEVTLQEDKEAGSTTYRYEGVPHAMERLSFYCEMLTDADFNFIPIDGEREETTLPDFEDYAGKLQLVQPIGGVPREELEKEGGEWGESLFSLEFWWGEDAFSVTVSQPEGGIVIPPPPEPMTLRRAMELFETADPADLMLEGDSMEDYVVYAQSGAVLIGMTPCLRMSVYEKDEDTHTNKLAGEYFLSNDGRHIYRADENGRPVELKN